MPFPFKGVSSVILFSSDAAEGPDPNFYKHADADVDGSTLVMSRARKVLYTSAMNERKAKSLCNFPVCLFSQGGPVETLKTALPFGKIGLDFGSIPASRYMRMAKFFGSKRLVDITSQLDTLRMVKTSAELADLKKSVRMGKEILEGVELKSTMTELDVVRQLARKCIEADVSFSFPPIVGAGSNSGNPHHSPTSKKLGNGIVLIDFGVKFNYFCSDLTRCFFLGAAKEERKKYTECKAIFNAVIDGLPACHTGGDIAKLADREVKRAGWPRMIHAVGHGLGLQVHEAPHLAVYSKEKLREGTPLAIEPGWYSSKFGVRYENDVVWGQKKARIL